MHRLRKKNQLIRLGDQLLFTGPAIFCFLAVIILPFLYGVYLTFFKWDGIASIIPFVGFKNYIGAIGDSQFWSSIWLTIKYVFAMVVLVNITAFFLAYFVTSGVKGQNVFRTSFFAPNLISGIALGFIWQFLFNRFFITIGQEWGIELLSKTWLGDENKAFMALVLVSSWQYIGYMMVIFVAGFINIPKDILEAAEIDGANSRKKLRYIILPYMVPSYVITTFLSLQRGFMVYDLNYSLTDGGPFGSTILASMYVYNKAFVRFDYGLGQAEAFVLFFIVAGITILHVSLSKRMEIEA